MGLIQDLFLVILTIKEEDAGTGISNALDVTVNVDGVDVFDRDFRVGFKPGYADVSNGWPPISPVGLPDLPKYQEPVYA
jgi:hypothetical protein